VTYGVQGKQFFFEKKNQKTFVSMARASGQIRDSDIKVSCFFSSERRPSIHPTRISKKLSLGQV
jgi:hypothetical protein